MTGATARSPGAWRLFVVCNARTKPRIFEYTADDMHREFELDPLAWECTPKART